MRRKFHLKLLCSDARRDLPAIPFVAKWMMGSTLLDHLELPDY